MMRTTLTLPDDVHEVIRSLAVSKRISMGDAVAELVRRGLNPTAGIDSMAFFPRFTVPEDAPPITLEKTLEAEDEL